MDETVQIELLRILQEALSNIARHSGATQVQIKIFDGADDFRFIITDNGKGFTMQDVEVKNSTDKIKHYGIHNIKERIQALNGQVDFINNGGTTIAIRLKNING